VLDFSQGISLRTSDTLIRGVVADGTIGMILRGDRNVVTRSAPDGGFAALRTSGDGNQVLRNRITSYEGEGIVARGRDVRIVRNEIRVEPAGFFPGIEVSAFANALVDRNDVFSGRSDGILLFDGAGAAVTRNRAHDSLYGIRVAATASNVLLRDNHADRNGYSGILVDSPSTTITRNTANDNGTYWPDDPTGGYGIEAVAGVTDGGKNRATGNARPEQCLNVRCR
jgi:parallel beta-helix repeat protein